MNEDTIAAISTAMTHSGIGIVRISGKDSLKIIDSIYQSKNRDKKLSIAKSHTVHYGYIFDGDILIDEVMVLILKSPNTYTTEDTVEIDCHGGILVMQRILETAVKYGARLAEPGEFTKRAFLNGRIDLSQAESVMDVINAKNDFALKSSMSQLKGSMREKIKGIREKILYEIAFIESALDDPEHISLEGYGKHLLEIISDVSEVIHILLSSSENGILLKEGINTVIVGKPNAGKSSLMNVLSGRDRAIVTDIAGTTRDILEEQINLNGITLNIIDTAGIRDTKDKIEQIGVDKSKECLQNADLVLYMVDSSTSFDEDDKEILNLLKKKKVIVLLNKTDLEQVTSEEDLRQILGEKGMEHSLICVSIKNKSGLEELELTIRNMFFAGKISFNDEICVTNVRQKLSLQSALESLAMVKRSIEDNMPEDFYSIDLMSAYEELGNIIGETVGEDLLNEIFSKFCMGK